MTRDGVVDIVSMTPSLLHFEIAQIIAIYNLVGTGCKSHINEVISQ